MNKRSRRERKAYNEGYRAGLKAGLCTGGVFENLAKAFREFGKMTIVRILKVGKILTK